MATIENVSRWLRHLWASLKKPKPKSWDTWVLIVFNTLCAAGTLDRSVSYVIGETPCKLFMLSGWVGLESFPLVMGAFAIEIALVLVLALSLLFAVRWAWYYVFAVTLIDISSFIPYWLVTPFNGSRPVAYQLPAFLRLVVAVVIPVIIAVHVYWLVKHKPRQIEAKGVKAIE